MPWSGTWTTPERNAMPADATGPFPILIPAEQPPREQSRLVLAGVAAALVVGLVLAVFSLRNFGGSGDDEPSSAVAPVTATQSPSAQASSTPDTRPAETPAATTAAPSVTVEAEQPAPKIAKIRAIDPQGGDNDENSDISPDAVDGVDSTAWNSDTYRSAAFGGLKKGLGLAILLDKPAVISKVEVDVKGSGGTVELRGGPTADFQKSTLLDSTKAGGKATLTNDSQDTYQYVIIWFTKLPTIDGEYRAEVSEVRVK